MSQHDGKNLQQVALPPAAYFNSLRVSHTPNEFILDFFQGQILDKQFVGQVVGRVMTNPAHMKKVVEAITKNLQEYEAAFGEISDPAIRGELLLEPGELDKVRKIDFGKLPPFQHKPGA